MIRVCSKCRHVITASGHADPARIVTHHMQMKLALINQHVSHGYCQTCFAAEVEKVKQRKAADHGLSMGNL